MKRPMLTLVLVAAAAGGGLLAGRALWHEPDAAARADGGARTSALAQVTAERDELAGKLRAAEEEADRLRAAARSAPAPDEASPPKEADAPPPAPDAPPTDEELVAGFKKFGKALGRVIEGEAEADVAALRELLARGGEPAVKKLIAAYGESTDINERIGLAHALAQSGDPAARETLVAKLRDPDAGMLEHRFASHALAFADGPEVEAVLAEVAHKSDDVGTRANASFGLARRGNDEGVAMYLEITDTVLEEGDPAALQYLGGFALLPDKALPEIRARLTTYENPQAVIVLIEILKSREDKAAAEQLKLLAYDANRAASIRQSAQAALKALGIER